MLTIDGSTGGGQVLRTSLALSAITGTPFRIDAIRGIRPKPGLLRQHLTCVRAAAEVCDATVEGDALGAMSLTFRPGTPRHGAYTWSIGSAGSAGLVLQTVWPILWSTPGSSTLVVEGGTHNPWAPPAEFLQRSFLPAVGRMGVRAELALEAYGFHPSGGGRYRCEVHGGPLSPCAFETFTAPDRTVDIVSAHVPEHVAHRERRQANRVLGLETTAGHIHAPESQGPGNAVIITSHTPELTQVHWALGRRGVRAEQVASMAARSALAAAKTPVCAYLADQLLVPMALAKGGHFRGGPPSDHVRTNADVVRAFTGQALTMTDRGDGTWTYRAGPISG